MAAEGAAHSGSGVAGMVCSLWVLGLASSVLALEGKREGRLENSLPAREVGEIQKRQKSAKTPRRGQVRGRFQRRAPDRQPCPCW